VIDISQKQKPTVLLSSQECRNGSAASASMQQQGYSDNVVNNIYTVEKRRASYQKNRSKSISSGTEVSIMLHISL